MFDITSLTFAYSAVVDLSMGLKDSPLNSTPTTATTTVANESVLNGFRHSVKKSIGEYYSKLRF